MTYRKPIRKVSKKYAKLLREYSPKRKAFLEIHEYCQVRLDCCTGRAEVIHHKKGKHSRELYLDEKYWMASCSLCNVEIEALGQKAYDLGLKIRTGLV